LIRQRLIRIKLRTRVCVDRKRYQLKGLSICSASEYMFPANEI